MCKLFLDADGLHWWSPSRVLVIICWLYVCSALTKTGSQRINRRSNFVQKFVTPSGQCYTNILFRANPVVNRTKLNQPLTYIGMSRPLLHQRNWSIQRHKDLENEIKFITLQFIQLILEFFMLKWHSFEHNIHCYASKNSQLTRCHHLYA